MMSLDSALPMFMWLGGLSRSLRRSVERGGFGIRRRRICRRWRGRLEVDVDKVVGWHGG